MSDGEGAKPAAQDDGFAPFQPVPPPAPLSEAEKAAQIGASVRALHHPDGSSAGQVLAAPGMAGPSPAPAKPAQFPPPVRATVDWLQSQFSEWYRHNPPAPPDRFTRREFGFILWPERPGPPPFVRHRAYTDSGRLHGYLQRAGPHSAYYSTAYYRRPGEMKMADKQWLGAELIFDLDADHLEKVEAAKAAGHEMPLDGQLRLVKEQFQRLLDEFLFGDFGLGPEDVWITFSGGRGYHAHVVEERLLQLGSKERREIVDYITGKLPTEPGTDEPDLECMLQKVATGADRFGRHVKARFTYRMAPVDAPGWPGRLSRALYQQLDENVFRQDRADAKRWLRSIKGVGPGSADKFLDRLDRFRQSEVDARTGIAHGLTLEQLIATGHISHKNDALYKVALKTLGQFGLPLAKGETDEPVTADTKRLIRLPGSLHGKTGLKVVRLRRDELDGFEPLRDAVAFEGGTAFIVPRNDQEVALAGERVKVRKGVEEEVPMAHAVFWLARQGGTIVAKGGKPCVWRWQGGPAGNFE